MPSSFWCVFSFVSLHPINGQNISIALTHEKPWTQHVFYPLIFHVWDLYMIEKANNTYESHRSTSITLDKRWNVEPICNFSYSILMFNSIGSQISLKISLNKKKERNANICTTEKRIQMCMINLRTSYDKNM